MRTLVGKQVFLDRERFVITGDRIEVLSHVALGPLHSAGAEFFGSHDVDVDLEIDTLQPLVPPMWLRAREGILHLVMPNHDPLLAAAARRRNREQLETELDEARE